MSKVGWLILTWATVAGAYLLLTVMMPTITDLANTANASMSANYNEAKAAMTASPLWLYFAPAVIGIGVTVGILKANNG